MAFRDTGKTRVEPEVAIPRIRITLTSRNVKSLEKFLTVLPKLRVISKPFLKEINIRNLDLQVLAALTALKSEFVSLAPYDCQSFTSSYVSYKSNFEKRLNAFSMNKDADYRENLRASVSTKASIIKARNSPIYPEVVLMIVFLSTPVGFVVDPGKPSSSAEAVDADINPGQADEERRDSGDQGHDSILTEENHKFNTSSPKKAVGSHEGNYITRKEPWLLPKLENIFLDINENKAGFAESNDHSDDGGDDIYDDDKAYYFEVNYQ
ncbi:hypothetical protein GH733_004041 [Mirounga leonina]|nr:hypothetical protein GH733_004041 [Mirounga leonina]